MTDKHERDGDHPEPWRVVPHGDIYDANGKHVYFYRESTARRVVAMVNACQDIDTETLETLQEHGVTLSTASPLVKARADEAEALLRDFHPAHCSAYCDGSTGVHTNECRKARAFLEARKP